MTAPVSGPIPGISIAGFTGVSAIGGTSAAQSTPSTSGADFASVLSNSIDSLQASQSKADNLATQAATGDLQDVHDYMIASNEASLATEMVVAIKNQAVSAFNEIMRMQV
jgi:flagellar hook-basal body complex protein FliE